MSVVIAIKDKDRFILGSDKQVSAGNRKDSTGTKVWEVEGYDNCCMGGVGYARANQILQYIQSLIDRNSVDFKREGITSAYVALALTETIWATLESRGMRCISHPEEGMDLKFLPNEFIFAYGDKCWVIHPDMSVTEVEDYVAIGSGEEVAIGNLDETIGQDPYTRIVKAIDKVADRTVYVNHDVDFVATKYIKSDMEKQMKALGYPKEDIDAMKVMLGITKPKKTETVDEEVTEEVSKEVVEKVEETEKPKKKPASKKKKTTKTEETE